MKLDVYASLPHYRDHLRAVWIACGGEGTWYSHFGDEETIEVPDRWPEPEVPVLVASYADACKVEGRPIIHLEHGAGQRYTGDPNGARHPSYAGGADMPRGIALFLTPNQAGADAWRQAYPTAAVAAVGCPKLDDFTGPVPARARSLRAGAPTAVLTFHWDCTLVPETRSALAHYDPWLPEIVIGLRRAGFQVFGHEHPRWMGRLHARWAELGVPSITDSRDVLALAHVLIADNTSLMYEAAAVGASVVALNAPWYRRDVEHGLRFWSAVPGPQVDEPGDVVGAAVLAVSGDASVEAMRRHGAEAAYRFTDGKAAERAAAAIETVVASL